MPPKTKQPAGRAFIAYARVSTDKQGKSGLGLAQEAAIRAFLGPADRLLERLAGTIEEVRIALGNAASFHAIARELTERGIATPIPWAALAVVPATPVATAQRGRSGSLHVDFSIAGCTRPQPSRSTTPGPRCFDGSWVTRCTRRVAAWRRRHGGIGR
jgi:hypothetical protein